ncbi:MAG TPA: HD domain-containing phosphohydrolase [Pyrinomonadaceae bacterium]|jgi:HD-GYP domain-containing protein (c-di-GMP phosphodiesterase class II)|nr:HD domain-containing phosphohydrolase [Pyrinomonadaceae bacterium]
MGVNSILADKPRLDDKLLATSSSMDSVEGYAAGQASRVAWVADALAEKFNLAPRDRQFLEQAALLHDIGEVTMNREYLRSARTLTATERLDLERHPVIGEQDIAKLDLPKSVQLIVRWHHEWWNGTGYPDGLEGEQIPLAARILRVADTYCSLTADRPWRQAMTDEAARRELTEWAGIEFDPAIVLAFRDVRMMQEAAPRASEPVSNEIFSTYR